MALCPITGESSLFFSELKRQANISLLTVLHIYFSAKTAPTTTIVTYENYENMRKSEHRNTVIKNKGYIMYFNNKCCHIFSNTDRVNVCKTANILNTSKMTEHLALVIDENVTDQSEMVNVNFSLTQIMKLDGTRI